MTKQEHGTIKLNGEPVKRADELLHLVSLNFVATEEIDTGAQDDECGPEGANFVDHLLQQRRFDHPPFLLNHQQSVAFGKWYEAEVA